MSDTTGGWFLTHGDGDVHGPYTLAALVQAARLGNITDTTQVRHATHTKDQWLRAVRMRPIAEAIESTSGESESSPEARSPGPAAARDPATDDAETAANSDVGVAVRKPRRSGRAKSALIVPESFGGAMVALFDFRFRYFITPWIVSITWATSVVLAAFAFVVFTFSFLLQPISTTAPTDRNRTVIEGTETPAGAVSKSPGWEFQPPAALRGHFGRIIAYGGVILAGGFGLLYLRVLFEGAIVAFRIASDLHEVRESLREK
jgi:hypothetical protein